MKKTFPIYEKGEIKTLKEGLSNRNKALIKKFLLFCGSSAGKNKLNNIERVMTKTCIVLEYDLDKLNLDILRGFLNILKQSDLMPPSKNEIKKYLKRFIKEFYPNWSKQFKGLEDIKLEKEVNKEKINSNTLLSPEEINQLIRGTDSIRNKTILSLAYETASRPEETLKLKWRDVDLKKGLIKLSSGKTGETRELPVIDSIQHLKRLKEEWGYQDINQDDFIFVSTQNREKHLTEVWYHTFLRNLGTRVLKKSAYPYLIRHSRLKVLQKKIPGVLYEKFAGHSMDTAKNFYDHMDTADLREVLMTNVYEIKDLSPEEKNELKLEIEELKKQMEEQTIQNEKKFDDFVIKVGEDLQKEFKQFQKFRLKTKV